MIDAELADVQWGKNTRARVGSKAPPTAAPAAPEAGEISYNEARRRTAIADMLIAEREAARQARTLVRVDDVKQLWADQLTACKSRLLNVPHRVAPQLPPEHYHKLFNLLLGEVHDALGELSRTDGVPAGAGDE